MAPLIVSVTSSSSQALAYPGRHASDKLTTSPNTDSVPISTNLSLKVILCPLWIVAKAPLHVGPNILNWVQVWALWWSYQALKCLLRFSVSHQSGSVSWCSIVLKVKACTITGHMSCGNEVVPENSKVTFRVLVIVFSILVPLALIGSPHHDKTTSKFHDRLYEAVPQWFISSPTNIH